MFHFVCINVFFPAPDENPAGVEGFGTESDNLVISWKVIKLYKAIHFNPEAFTGVQGLLLLLLPLLSLVLL